MANTKFRKSRNVFCQTFRLVWNKNGWYENSPVGINTLPKWTKISTVNIGLDTEKLKITNHSTTVSQLLESRIGDPENMKIIGQEHLSSMNPYLQLKVEHHQNILINAA